MMDATNQSKLVNMMNGVEADWYRSFEGKNSGIDANVHSRINDANVITAGTTRLSRENRVFTRSKTLPVISKGDDGNSLLALKDFKSRKCLSSSDLVAFDDTERQNEILNIIREAHTNMRIVNSTLSSLGEGNPFRKTKEMIPQFGDLQSHLKTHFSRNNVLKKNQNMPQKMCFNDCSFLANCMFYASSSFIDHKIDFLQPTFLCKFDDYKLKLVSREKQESLNHQDIERLRAASKLEQSDPPDKNNDSLPSSNQIKRKKHDQTSKVDSHNGLMSIISHCCENVNISSYKIKNIQKESAMKSFHFFANFTKGFKNEGNEDPTPSDVNKTISTKASYIDDSYDCFLDEDESQKSRTLSKNETELIEQNRSELMQLTGLVSSEAKEDKLPESNKHSHRDNVEYSAHISDNKNRINTNGITYIVYILEVDETGNGTFRVEHRYNAFHRLHLALMEEKISMQSKFPKKYGVLAKITTKNIISRRTLALNLWLNELTGHLAWGKIVGKLKERCVDFLRKSDDCWTDINQSSRQAFRNPPLLLFVRRDYSDSQASDLEDTSNDYDLLEEWPTSNCIIT